VSLRGRFLLVSLLVAILPLTTLAIGLRRESARQIRELYGDQVMRLEFESRRDLAERGQRIDRALLAARERLLADNRFRRALIESQTEDQRYRVDLGESLLGLTGLDVFEIQDDVGRVVTSGHFREQFDRAGLHWPDEDERPLFAQVSLPERSVWARIRTLSFEVAGRPYRMMGGALAGWESDPSGEMTRKRPVAAITLRVLDDRGRPVRSAGRGDLLEGGREGDLEGGQGDDSDRGRVERDSLSIDVSSSLHSASEWIRRDVPVALFWGPSHPVASGRLTISVSTTLLEERLAELDRWFLGAALGTVLFALALAYLAAGALSRPLQALAEKTTHVRIGRRFVNFRTERDDELGDLSRFIGAMVDRLQGSAEQLREAERTATVGEIARQVHHDIRNGLTPIRNVMRHLSEVSARSPEELSATFAERSGTIEAGLEYLDDLSTNYARLTPRQERAEVDLNTIVHAVADPLAHGGTDVRFDLARETLRVLADPVGLRRIVENLLRNASESLSTPKEWVEVRTERLDDITSSHNSAKDGEARFTQPGVILTVRDTGAGMDKDTQSRVFEHFYSTKPTGVGLGLGIVRRLVADFSGRIDLESVPGSGTIFRIWFPEVLERTNIGNGGSGR